MSKPGLIRPASTAGFGQYIELWLFIGFYKLNEKLLPRGVNEA